MISFNFQAIKLTQLGKVDFVDYLIGEVNHHYERSKAVSFDRQLKEEKCYRVLSYINRSRYFFLTRVRKTYI